MTKSVQDLLKKISYIEAEVEIQKNILVTLSSEDKSEIEKIVGSIAKAKKDIEEIRLQIREIDPEEEERISRIEDAAAAFKKKAVEISFSSITSLAVDGNCSLRCRDGRIIECLVKGCHENGDWTVISIDGRIIEFSCDDVLSDSD